MGRRRLLRLESHRSIKLYSFNKIQNSFPLGKVFLNTIEYMDNVHEEWMTMLPNLRDESSGAPEKEKEEAIDVKVAVDAQEEVPSGVTEESPPAESPCGN